MYETAHACDVLVIGGGPAGLAAASHAARCGRRVIIVDDNPRWGGQIWRRGSGEDESPQATSLFDEVRRAGVKFIGGAHVFNQLQDGSLLAEAADGVHRFSYEKLILATGARERFLPFPGWTLPNVMGAGGLQALVKSGLSIRRRRVVVAGSGPLLLAVAAHLRKRGAEVLLIAEQAPRARVLRFGLRLIEWPEKLLHLMRLQRYLFNVPYLTGCWPVMAHGRRKLERVTLKRGARLWEVACDYLACGFHLVPNAELAQLLGCETVDGAVWVDELQRTSRPEIYCAGEATGVGGVELALIEGQIAGCAAAGREDEARRLFAARQRARRFASALNAAFDLREELRELATEETIVCRCEDVRLGQLREFDSWRAAKLQTRCGMGPCQGRVCGAALEFLFGWRVTSIRPPLFPVQLRNLAYDPSSEAERVERG
ncbi:NAD(P)/FAD-dependent oxidoreductase [Pyrinomonas methylaliphatogenes]|uniref:NAD(FAD)-dependent dehydrogenase n=1 Tax=Pyrinomonas methylaliphatogenes TaxID=454194 RepID=A0A0B6WUP7_9BACT|nr:FAD/NAD(P)-binding oxidoreductase [Pyrinomonas methylaliphatogenes]CDM64746.1 NAD(FAD)-dependent dehydrogenase [Pyrinomonas methylaliphatogenes]